MTPTSLDPNNQEFAQCVELIKYSYQNLYLTGKAGTGKTTFLNYIKKHIHKKHITLAPTGLAAIQAGGQTLHSFFSLPFGPLPPEDSMFTYPEILERFKYNKEKMDTIKEIDTIFIDEISMVRADVLDAIDKVLRFYRNQAKVPFGGVQMVLIGDAYQLAPVTRSDDWQILKRFYSSSFFFNSHSYAHTHFVHVELKKIYRQTDQRFIDLLNRVRVNQLNSSDIDTLNQRFVSQETTDKTILIATHNREVDRVNLSRLDRINESSHTFTAEIQGEFRPSDYPTQEQLELKVGARVMLVKNNHTQGLYNGMLGTIESISAESKSIQILFDEQDEAHEIEAETWHNIRYAYNRKTKKVDSEIIGTFAQLPLKLAWAISVHKSQGLTFDHVRLSIASSFSSGQSYVALSRCRRLEGIELANKISARSFITSREVIQHAKQETPLILIKQQVQHAKAESLYIKAWKSLKKHDFETAFLFFIQAQQIKGFETLKHADRIPKILGYYLSSGDKKARRYKLMIKKLLD